MKRGGAHVTSADLHPLPLPLRYEATPGAAEMSEVARGRGADKLAVVPLQCLTPVFSGLQAGCRFRTGRVPIKPTVYLSEAT